MDDRMTALCMTEDSAGQVEFGEVSFCETHEAELRAALIQRGLSEDLELTVDEREAKILSGDIDAFIGVKNRLIMSALSIFGPHRIMSYGGCPVCVFHTVIDQAADEIACERTKKN